MVLDCIKPTVSVEKKFGITMWNQGFLACINQGVFVKVCKRCETKIYGISYIKLKGLYRNHGLLGLHQEML